MKIELKRCRGRKICEAGIILIALSMVFGGCSQAKETIEDYNTEPAVTTETEAGQTGSFEDYEYTVLGHKEYGPTLWRGWYIRDTAEEKYILICDGMKYTGGYYINIKDVSYDKSGGTVVITVATSRDQEVTTDAYTYPCCAVKFNMIPEKIMVTYDTGDAMEFGGNIIDTEEWAVDTKIDENYMAVFTNGDRHKTYVYETSDGKYRYINVLKRGDEIYVKGSGTAETMYYLDYVTVRFGSKRNVLIKGDEDHPIDADEYINSFNEGQING